MPIEETTTYPNETSVGSGPFQAASVEDDGTIRMAQRTDTADPSAQVDQIVFRSYGYDEELGTALRDGEIDYATGLGIEQLRQAGAETFIHRGLRAPTPASRAWASTSTSRTPSSSRS